MIATTSSPLASSTVTSVLTAPGKTRLTVPFNELRALMSIVYALLYECKPQGNYTLFPLMLKMDSAAEGRNITGPSKKNLCRNRIKPYMYIQIPLQESAGNSIGEDTYGITQIASGGQ